VPLLKRPDGAQIHWWERGEGPVVVVAPWWSGMPGAIAPFDDDIARDHRLVYYDARGTGRSSAVGPHDMETGAADLAAVVEAAGGPAVIVAIADGCNRAVRVAAARPDLVHAVVAPASVPIGRGSLEGAEGMAASDEVIAALINTLDSYYESGLRNIISSANTQMSEDEIRERVERQAAHVPREVAIARLQAWVADEPTEYARAIGDRLVLLLAPTAVGPWFPPLEQMRVLARDLVPEARVEVAEDGLVSAPDEAAAVVRSVTVTAPVAGSEI
jgi:pimeloyl-ACP methyl ester carboxylesterase